MATAARYWRFSFNSYAVIDYASAGFVTLVPYDADGVSLAPGVASIASSAAMLTGYNTTSHMLDEDTATIVVAQYSTYRSTHVWRSFTFDFGEGNAPSVDYFLLRLSSTSYYNTVIPANTINVMVYASTDNLTWVPQMSQDTCVPSFNANRKVAATATSTTAIAPMRYTTGGSGGIYGIVSEDGVALPNRPVYLYERTMFERVGYTITDENGGYGFNGLNEDLEFMVMSQDPSGPPYKNAIVWDRIRPINTKGDIAPASAFWALRARDRALGAVFTVANYLDGATKRFLGAGLLGNSDRIWWSDAYWNGFGFDTQSAVGGSILFLKSSRSATSAGIGLFIQGGEGLYSGRNAAGITDNYSRLSFECILRTPMASESSMILVWGGTSDSDDRIMYGYDGWQSYSMRPTGPTIEVLPTGVINVRMPLGARNRATVRCTYSAVPGTINHIVVTYEQDTTIKLYVNGVLRSTASIAGSGRLWGHTQRNANYEDWDTGSFSSGYTKEAAIRRLNMLTIGGSGYQNAHAASITYRQWEIPPGWGGAIGLAAIYGSVFSAEYVTSLYQSFINWDSFVVQSYYSGYMAEVEADNPKFYARLNQLSSAERVISSLGLSDHWSWYEGTPVFGGTGFVGGTTALTTTTGSLIMRGVTPNATCSIEFFCRPASVSGTQALMTVRAYEQETPMYLYSASGALNLRVCDSANTSAVIPLNFTMVAGSEYHVVVQYDPWTTKTTRCFINGSLVTEVPAPVMPFHTTNHNAITVNYTDDYPLWLSIGSNVSGTGPTVANRFVGQIGEFALYNYMLSAERVLAHYEARNA
jgi:hypothetical protein